MAGHAAPDIPTVDGAGLRLGVVASRWHHELTDQMLHRASAAAKAHGVTELTAVRVAGSVELPVLVQQLTRSCDAVVALGVVIRGETAHFDYVCQSVTEGLTRIALDAGVPVGHGVLAVENMAQARARAGLPESAEDKGWDATVAVLDAAVTLRSLRGGGGRATT